MERYERLLVCLELAVEPVDQAIIEYTAKITRMAKSKTVYFIHVVPTFDLPADLIETYPNLMPVDEMEIALLQDRVNAFFGTAYPETDIQFDVLEGETVTEILRYAKNKLIDLVVLGKKKADHHVIVTEKVTRKSPCSVLIIPEGCGTALQQILVPVDFSRYSEIALNVAIEFAAAVHPPAQIQVAHTYDVPAGYYKTGKTYDEFAAIMAEHAREKYQQLIQRVDVQGIAVQPVFKLDSNVVNSIEALLTQEKSDLLVLGARGQTDPASLILGSKTTKLIRQIEIPMLVVREKGDRVHLLEALLQI